MSEARYSVKHWNAGFYGFHAARLHNAKPQMCGYYGDPKRQCRCSVRQIEQYRQKISGPLLDRIDLHIEVPAVDFRELSSAAAGEPSANIRERVSQARTIQLKRFKTSRGTKTNAAMSARHVRDHCGLDAEGQGFLEQAMEEQHFSARAHGRILKVARTIADLAGEEKIGATHVLEAIQFRSLDRKLFQ